MNCKVDTMRVPRSTQLAAIGAQTHAGIVKENGCRSNSGYNLGAACADSPHDNMERQSPRARLRREPIALYVCPIRRDTSEEWY